MKRWILNKLLSYLFNAVTEDDVLRWDSQRKVFHVGDFTLPASDTKGLSEEAKYIMSTSVWSYLVKDMKHQANVRMYERSTNVDDLVFGKAMLWNLEILEKKLKNLSKLV